MKTCRTKMEEKKYRRQGIKNRISRLMRYYNVATVIGIMTITIIAVNLIVGTVSTGFSQVTAQMIASDIEDYYGRAENPMHKDMDMSEMSQEDKMEIGESIIQMEATELYDRTTLQFGDVDFRVYEYEIVVGDISIYDSFNELDDEWYLHAYDKGLIETNAFEGSIGEFYNPDGEMIGYVCVSVSPIILFMSTTTMLLLGIIVFIVNIIFSKIMQSVMTKTVAEPLETLAKQIHDLANDDLEDAFNVVLEVNRPISEVVSLKDSTNQIMKKIAEYYELTTAQNEELMAQRDELESQRDVLESVNDELEAQKDELEVQKDELEYHKNEIETSRDELEAQRGELEAQRDELESQNDQLITTSNTLQSMNNAYLGRTLKLQNLLDNIDQGFITFSENLLIDAEYSLTCENMLCELQKPESLTNKKVTEYLFDDQEQIDFIDSLLVKILKGTDRERNLFLPLLPDEIELHGRPHRVEYKLVKDELGNDKMMVILTDITETRELERQMNLERDRLQMLVKVLMNRDDFLLIYKDIEYFLDKPFKSYDQESYDEILRLIHTLKGATAQYYMTNTSNKLNCLEEEVYGVGDISAINSIDVSAITEELEKDIAYIKAYVGDDILENDDLYSVKEEKIIEIEQKIKNLLPASEFNKVIPIIKSIRHREVKDGLKSYPDYVSKLADRLEKSVHPFEIEGDEVFVDFDIYQEMFKSMIHVFRNGVDHGIETIDERIENGKSETANIGCRVVKLSDNSFEVIVEDDGSGIDRDKVKRVAAQKGMYTEEELDAMSDEQVLNILFEQRFSTKSEATAISGRGVGLAAVKEQVERLGGEIYISSEEGLGTKMTLHLPIIQGADIVQFEPHEFIDQIDEVSTGYLRDLGFDFPDTVKDVEDNILIQRVTSLINIKGSLDGLLVVSTNEKFAKKLAKSFIIGDIKDEELELYYDDVLGEITNTVLGNVLGVLEDKGIYLTMGVPVMLANHEASIKYSNRQIYSVKYKAGEDIITFSVLMTENTLLDQDVSFDNDDLFFDKEEI